MNKIKKISILQFFLTVVYTFVLLISNIIAKPLMITPDIITTCGIIIFPITYILSDVFSEIYGYKWSRITCYLAFILNLVMVLIFAITLIMPYPNYWENQQAYMIVLGNTPKLFIASMLAFFVGDLVNDYIFEVMKKKHLDSHKKFGLRAIISSFFGELCDSFIYIPIAFFGELTFIQMLGIIAIEISIKILYEIILLPLTTYVVKRVEKKELQLA